MKLQTLQTLQTLENYTTSIGKTNRERPCPNKNDPRARVRRFVNANWEGSDEKLRYLFGATNKMSETLLSSGHEGIVCYHKINHARHLNRFLATINRSLIDGGTFIGCVETEKQLKIRIRSDYTAIMQWVFRLVHTVVIFFRPASKTSKKWYKFATNDVYRVIPLNEVFDRLHSNGFAIFDFEEISGQTYFAVRKIKNFTSETARDSLHDAAEYGDIALEHAYFPEKVCLPAPVGYRNQVPLHPVQNN